MSRWQVIEGECVAMMQEMEGESVDAIVCDPPYDLLQSKHGNRLPQFGNGIGAQQERAGRGTGGGFMGMKWDGTGIAFDPATWIEALRVAKPGAHLVAFGGTRTYHRMVCAIEDAGWEIRDCIAWHYGSGFPKSRDVSKDMDKMAGADREEIGVRDRRGTYDGANRTSDGDTGESHLAGRATTVKVTLATTQEAKQWEGWGTALKPSFEPIVLARKPLSEKTIAQNVLTHGTGALNIDASRIGTDVLSRQVAGKARLGTFERTDMVTPERTGRWPANTILDEYAAAEMDRQGSASRFFYIAKPSAAEREARCEGLSKRVKMRDDLTDEERAFVIAELQAAGVLL